jgi:hypothetical protein
MSIWWMVPVVIGGGAWCAWALCRCLPLQCDDCGAEGGVRDYSTGNRLCDVCVAVRPWLWAEERAMREKARASK